MKHANPIIAHILEQRKKRERAFFDRLEAFAQHQRSAKDDKLAEMLSEYSIDQVSGLLSNVIADKSLSRWNRKYVVGAITMNQPHAAAHFTTFLDWNKDVWQSRLIVPLMMVLPFLPGFLAWFYLPDAGLDVTSSTFISIAISLVLLAVGAWVVRRNSMLFVMPGIIYRDRFDHDAEGNKYDGEWELPKSFDNRNLSGAGRYPG